MPTPVASVPEYCQGLARSRLLPNDRVTMLYNVFLARGAGSDSDVEGFRKFLTMGRHLTEYQAALVARGHVDGFLIGGYVILDRIGKGQSAGVYKAVHPGSGQVVALKVLPGSKARHPQALARFQREGRLLASLDHPNVVRAFQVGNNGGAHFIVMEHLDGETLDEVLVRRNTLPAPEATRLLVQALLGLQHLHERRMIHRDLKPANLMLVPGGATTLDSTLKVLDIGLGREFFEDRPGGDALTIEGAVLGTPDYLAPEQARDARTADVRADIYSLGCVLYHLLAGAPPFAEKTLMAAMVRHATEPPAPIDGLPADLAAVLARMLAKRAEDRYHLPIDAANALLEFVPPDASPAADSRIIPAFQQWLASEGREPGRELGPMSSSRLPRGPMSSSRLIGPASSARLSGPVSSARINRAGPVSMPRMGLAAAGPPPPPPPPRLLKPPTAAPRPAPVLIAPEDTTPPSEADVELMPLEELQARIVYSAMSRPLWVLDRRDLIMLGLGSGGVIAAIGIGILAAKFNADKIRRGPELD